MRRVAVGLLVALGVAGGWHLLSRRESDATAFRASTQVHACDTHTKEATGATSPDTEQVPQVLQEKLAWTIATFGADSEQARAIHLRAVATCEGMRLNPHLRPVNPSPDRAWALGRLDHYCATFRAEAWEGIGTRRRGAFDTDLREGEAAATTVALADLGETVDDGLLREAGYFLIGKHRLPRQADYGLDEEGLMRAFSMATGLRTCAATFDCGPDALQTSIVCAEVGCPPGTTYVDAMRRALSPAEFAAGLRIRDDLASR